MEIYQKITSIEIVRQLLVPLLEVESIGTEMLCLATKNNNIRSGRFKRKVAATFEIKSLQQLQIPAQNLVALINCKYDCISLFQWQAIPTKFDFYVSHKNCCPSKKLDQALMNTVINLVGGNEKELTSFTYWSCLGKFKEESVRQKLLSATGYQLAHQLVYIWQSGVGELKSIPGKSSSTSTTSSLLKYQNFENPETPCNSRQQSSASAALNKRTMGAIITDAKGHIFDIQEFGRGCLRVMENLLLFTTNDILRKLQLETNPQQQQYMLRLLDHRPLIQELWKETLDFALQRQGMEVIAEQFTAEQVAVLFNCNRQAITDTFNQFILGKRDHITQPHPIRALLDHLPFLSISPCFDISWYNFRQYGLNWLLASFFLAKNFLTDDYSLRSNQGAICFNGAPGSGKSRISQILFQFMNGFSYQDSTKGITEFQNFDIVSKSFIRSEEVQIKRLSTSDWKMLADIESAVKCKIKNQQDVEVTKFVPVVITSNGQVYEELIQKIYTNADLEAAHRRWGFIRYFETWNSAHPELFSNNGNTLDPAYAQLYANINVNHQLMNSLVAQALLFTRNHFVLQDYIIPYYSHCLQEFSKTLFGQVLLMNIDYFQNEVPAIVNLYTTSTDKICFEEQTRQACKFEEMCLVYIKSHLVGYDMQLDLQYEILVATDDTPLYLRCLSFCLDPLIKKKLDSNGPVLVRYFLDQNKATPIYYHVLQHMLGDDLLCKDEWLPPSDEQAQQNAEQQEFHIDYDFVDFSMLGDREEGRCMSYTEQEQFIQGQAWREK